MVNTYIRTRSKSYLEIQLIMSITEGDNKSCDFVGHRK